jgi:crotonobetainyl-CoA:carnitine CoA-transferase CaiB-like acyl-CoA transferase
VLAGRFVEHPAQPGLPQIPFPSQLSEGMLPLQEMRPPPQVGEHSAALLAELGYSADAVAQLVRDRAVRLGAAEATA